MNAPDLLRAGGWRQGHHQGSGNPYWEHAERYGLARYSVDAALADELARVSRERDMLQLSLQRERQEAPTEPHWLIKDFNALYRAALKLFDECEGAFGGSAERTRRALGAKLERLKPAFAETEAAREAAGKAGGQ